MFSRLPPPQLFLLTAGGGLRVHLVYLGDEAPLVFVDEDSPQGSVTVPDVEVVLVPTTGLSLADDGHPEHDVLALNKTTFQISGHLLRNKPTTESVVTEILFTYKSQRSTSS